MSRRTTHLLRSTPALAMIVMSAACGASDTSATNDAESFYALVEGIDGVYFYPPLGPEPTPAAAFDGTLLDGLSVSLESEDAAGVIEPLVTYDAKTQPAVALLADQERYWVNISAAPYVTDPAKTYRVRVFLDGSQLGMSVLSGHIFEVMRYNPALPIGVHVRVEGTGAVRAIPRQRSRVTGTPAHCSDHIRNKDETGVDCGGGCSPCCIPQESGYSTGSYGWGTTPEASGASYCANRPAINKSLYPFCEVRQAGQTWMTGSSSDYCWTYPRLFVREYIQEIGCRGGSAPIGGAVIEPQAGTRCPPGTINSYCTELHAQGCLVVH